MDYPEFAIPTPGVKPFGCLREEFVPRLGIRMLWRDTDNSPSRSCMSCAGFDGVGRETWSETCTGKTEDLMWKSKKRKIVNEKSCLRNGLKRNDEVA